MYMDGLKDTISGYVKPWKSSYFKETIKWAKACFKVVTSRFTPTIASSFVSTVREEQKGTTQSKFPFISDVG